jgi:hypothetical protein
MKVNPVTPGRLHFFVNKANPAITKYTCPRKPVLHLNTQGPGINTVHLQVPNKNRYGTNPKTLRGNLADSKLRHNKHELVSVMLDKGDGGDREYMYILYIYIYYTDGL